jgi:CRP/FNR family transcriptional regulator
MSMQQSDLFFGVDSNFIKRLMQLGRTITLVKNDYVFKEGESADFFYILIRGGVRVGVGETGQKVYHGCTVGEVYGLCALFDHPVYSASAVCATDADLLKIHKKQFFKLLDADVENAIIFYKRFTNVLGKRLIHSYEIIEKLSEIPSEYVAPL